MTSRAPKPAIAELPDALVVGSGPGGLICGLALAEHGLATRILGPAPTPDGFARDTRTTALFGGSITMLHRLGVWPALVNHAEPLAGLRLVDDTGGLLRTPEVLFEARELGLDAFGYNIPNSALLTALHRAAASRGLVEPTDWLAETITYDAAAVTVARQGGSERRAARLLVGADGRRSLARTAAGIDARRWTYSQTAIAATFSHSRPHGSITTELHRRAGPLAVVPLKGMRSSAVWVETPAEAERLNRLPPEAFAEALASTLQGLLGRIGNIEHRSLFPLSGLAARPLARHRIALVGEAGHVLPPIGAQGLNLAFRDAAWIGELAGAAKAAGADPGASSVLEAYDEARRTDVEMRSGAVDALNRSLIADLVPLHLARGAGVLALKALPLLRRLVMRAGIGPAGRQPRLMAPL